MPTCPACGVSVGYDELRSHLGTCKFVWSETPERTDRFTERLARKVRLLEQRFQPKDRNAEATNPEDADRAGDSDRRTHRLR